MILIGCKWNYEKKVRVLTIDPKDLQRFNDKRLLQEFSELFEQADICVAHFGSVFDRRFIQGRLLINKLPPIPPTKMRDTCMIARSVANFSSNRLKHLAKILDLKNQKLENNWPSAWFKVMQGDERALRGLAKYCAGDVLALEELYLTLQPFDNPHPRMYTDRSVCGLCGGAIQYRGFAYVGVNKYRRYRCSKCGKWGRETTAWKD